MVGQAMQRAVPGAIYLSSRDCDLTNTVSTFNYFSECAPDAVIHLAARVGGIKANMEYMADFYYDNVMINTNVLEAARCTGVKKVVSLLSTCVYPDDCDYPLNEDTIHNGRPHSSNFAYAHAKRQLDVQSRAYRQQYGSNFVTAVPNNLFGEHDNFHLENSHVIPAIVRKVYEAKQNNGAVHLWGDGTPLREFTYSEDLARILWKLLEEYDDPCPINIGNPHEVTIKEMAQKICQALEFEGDVFWDTTQPRGQLRKPSDISRFRELGGFNYTSLDVALNKTREWFIMNYPNLRGIESA